MSGLESFSFIVIYHCSASVLCVLTKSHTVIRQSSVQAHTNDNNTFWMKHNHTVTGNIHRDEMMWHCKTNTNTPKPF